jgi:hypothetical protein
MTALQPPLFIGVNGQIGADELGLPFRDLIGEGTLGAGDLAVAQRAAGANMSVDIAAGAAWVKGDDDVNAQPTYRVRNDATVNLAVSASDATKPRVDRIVARVRDSAFAGVSLAWTLEVVPGVATTGATLANLSGAAAVPNTTLLLANVLVPAASTTVVTANIDDKRVRAGLALSGGATNGQVPVWNATSGKWEPGALAGSSTLAYTEFTSTVSVTATTDPGTTLVSSGSITCDGSPLWVEFSCAEVTNSASLQDSLMNLLVDGVVTGFSDFVFPTTAASPCLWRRRLTPSAGTHTFGVAGRTTSGTTQFIAGSGSGSTRMPGYIRVTKEA